MGAHEDTPHFAKEIELRFRAMASTDAEWAAKLAKINKSKEVFRSGVTRSWEWREQQLKQFVKFLDNEKVSGVMMNMTNSLYRHPEPLGTVLIMGAWNYPFDLCLNPLVGAIGAGCTAIIKPSEVAKASSKVI